MKHCWITLHSPGENCVLKIGNHRSVKVLFFKKKSHLASKISTICKSLLTCLEAKSTQRCRTSPPSAKTCSTESASFRVERRKRILFENFFFRADPAIDRQVGVALGIEFGARNLWLGPVSICLEYQRPCPQANNRISFVSLAFLFHSRRFLIHLDRGFDVVSAVTASDWSAAARWQPIKRRVWFFFYFFFYCFCGHFTVAGVGIGAGWCGVVCGGGGCEGRRRCFVFGFSFIYFS